MCTHLGRHPAGKLDREGGRETHTRAHTGGIETRDLRDTRGTRTQTRAHTHTGADDDDSGVGPLLWRYGEGYQCAQHPHAGLFCMTIL